MAGPMEVREIEVVNAIADTIVARTNLLPTAHLTAPTVVDGNGSPILYVDTIAGFQKRGHAHFFDDTGELMAPIKDIDAIAKTITLDYQGYAEHSFGVGLQFVHNTSALIATNLMLHRPMQINAELHSGKPVVCVWSRHKKNFEFSTMTTIAPTVVRIQVHVAIEQFDSLPIDPESYNQIQQDASHDAMQSIENALNQNRHLMAMYNSPGTHANGLGDGNSKEWAQSLWDVVIDNVDIPQAVGALEVIVRPRRYVRQEPS